MSSTQDPPEGEGGTNRPGSAGSGTEKDGHAAGEAEDDKLVLPALRRVETLPDAPASKRASERPPPPSKIIEPKP